MTLITLIFINPFIPIALFEADYVLGLVLGRDINSI